MRRDPAGPILTRDDVPDVPPLVRDVSSVFNPGAAYFRGRRLLLLRVQTRGRETVWMPAWSTDGVSFDVEPKIVTVDGLDSVGEPVHHAYDPRLTVLEDALVVAFAVDTDDACRVAIARGTSVDDLELVAYDTLHDSRNAVVFPSKVGGRYLRLERPNRVARAGVVPSGAEIVLAESDDLVAWSEVGPVMQGRPRSWDELIGSGPPPVRTRHGWLHVYHGVATHFASVNIYQAGAVLLDADDPTQVLARTRRNLLEPREPYELTGQVPNVVFPSGSIIEGVSGDEIAEDDALVRLYYGAADTCVGRAETTIGELIAACEEA
jgi:beta-1,4-mannooligosaccharide/beta-1,4-mannosyl-N-acetylglucosamine phosphorylase